MPTLGYLDSQGTGALDKDPSMDPSYELVSILLFLRCVSLLRYRIMLVSQDSDGGSAQRGPRSVPGIPTPGSSGYVQLCKGHPHLRGLLSSILIQGSKASNKEYLAKAILVIPYCQTQNPRHVGIWTLLKMAERSCSCGSSVRVTRSFWESPKVDCLIFWNESLLWGSCHSYLPKTTTTILNVEAIHESFQKSGGPDIDPK